MSRRRRDRRDKRQPWTGAWDNEYRLDHPWWVVKPPPEPDKWGDVFHLDPPHQPWPGKEGKK
ncbi:MAG: hypothetical protein LBH31_01995 [Burkholderiaceae bacterium]|jgi:hypothetical protein|nr:hypothetical protein [Burkholderiaceae bacterium]